MGAKPRPIPGPYSRLVQNGSGDWHLRLTDEGRDVAEQYLRQHPYPAAMLASAHPKLDLLLRTDQRLRGQEEQIHSAAVLGVVNAVARFRPEKGFALSTYVCIWVRKECEQLIRLKKGQPTKYYHPDTAFVDDDDSAWDSLASVTDRRPQLLPSEAAKMLNRLDERDRKVLMDVYYHGRYLREIAKEMGVSVSMASLIHVEAMEELKWQNPQIADCMG